MKWFWAVDCDNAVDEPYVSDSGDLISFEEWRFWDGRVAHICCFLQMWGSSSLRPAAFACIFFCMPFGFLA